MKPSALLSFLILFSFTTLAQDNPAGDPAEIRNAILNSNNITFIMYNYGQYARPNTLANIADLVWRSLGYMYEFGPLLAAEVVNDNGDTLRIVDDGLWLQGQGDYAPGTGIKWGWLPRTGYARAGQPSLATSNNPASWPISWTAWPGEFGTGVIIGRDEAFYGMDDFTNAEFPYFPFPSDTTKRGLGVSAEVRTYQFGGNLADAIIIKWKVKNESPRFLRKCYFGFYGDPHIGGAIDFNDDLTFFVGRNGPNGDPSRYWARNTVYVWDANGIGTYGLPTGYMGFKFLMTPNDSDLTTFYALPYGGANFPANDALFWRLLSTDSIAANQPMFTTPGDNVIVYGTGPFSLNAGDSTFVSLAMFFSEGYQDLLDDANYIHFASHWPNISGNVGQSGGDPAYTINLVSPNGGTVNGSVPITWSYTGTDPNAKILIEYSSDRGYTWRPLVWNHPLSQAYTWNTLGVRDGVNFLLRIVAHSEDLSHYYYDVTDQRFTINNPVNAQPELAVNLPFERTTVRTPPLPISWTAEDADNSALQITISYALSSSGPFTQIISNSYQTGSQTYYWDFTQAPNGPTYYLKVTASDGNSDSTVTSRSFAISQEAGHYHPDIFQHVAGRGTPDLSLQVVDPGQLTRHQYEMTFSVVHPDSFDTKRLTVRDLFTGIQVVSNYLLRPGISTPLFDGLKLTVTDKRPDINLTRSRFNRSILDTTVNFTWGNLFFNRVKVAQDWFFSFHNLDTLPNGRYMFPGDTIINQLNQAVVICPFRLVNVDSMQPGKAVIRETLPSNNRWDFNEPIVLRPQVPASGQVSYQVNFDFSLGIRPGAGDTLWVITDKPLTSADVFRFVPDSNYVTGVPSATVVEGYTLSNNYPNPFNPRTAIEYRIPSKGVVTLKVFDVLGRGVATIIEGFQDEGSYRVEIDATNLASGVYFYRLQAGTYVAVKKMILLK